MKKRKEEKISKIILCILFLILFYFSMFINERFDDITFEQLIYNITNTEGANYSVVWVGAKYIVIRLLITFIVLYVLYKIYKLLKIKIYFNIGFKDKTQMIHLSTKNKIFSILVVFIFAFVSLLGTYKLLNIDSYIQNQTTTSNMIEEYYVDARDIKLKFPKEKQNLIYIYAESIETTNVSVNNGGITKESYIPKLEKLALSNINFSNTDKLGGAYQLNNTNWTIAALVAHTSGIPLKLSITSNLYNEYGNFLPGVYNLGDILNDNGYNNYFMIGSNAEFGGRKIYFETHGNYRIYDYYYAIDKGFIDKDYYEWWGYEDQKLFEFAKTKIIAASKKDEPFNFTILTVDTHFTDGYMDDTCTEEFDSAYANALYCSDSKIYSFVNWIKKQDFYKNTTIIISGDHLTMQNDFYEENNNYERTTYNTFINSKAKPIQDKNRMFSTLDMFPTTLAALGVEIEGDRLGLGVNLFSKEKTLIEEYGFEYVDNELSKKSIFYNEVLLGKTNKS